MIAVATCGRSIMMKHADREKSRAAAVHGRCLNSHAKSRHRASRAPRSGTSLAHPLRSAALHHPRCCPCWSGWRFVRTPRFPNLFFLVGAAEPPWGDVERSRLFDAAAEQRGPPPGRGAQDREESRAEQGREESGRPGLMFRTRIGRTGSAFDVRLCQRRCTPGTF